MKVFWVEQVSKLKVYLGKQLGIFNKSDFAIGRDWKGAVSTFLYWAVPAFLTVYFVDMLGEVRSVEYYNKAISQGIGPILWNFIAVMGFAMFGVAFIFNKIRLFSAVAHQLLINVYAIGALTFGLLLGQFIVLAPELKVNIATWKLFFIFPITAFSFVFILFLNAVIWYISHLSRANSPFMERLSSLNFFIRLVVGLFFSGLFLVLLWFEK